MVHGWIILDKPEGMTSTRAGSIIKRVLKQKKLGHAGTLDPFATGVLPLALGEATKVMPYMVADQKEYEFELTFGEERDSGDRDGTIVATSSERPTAEQLQSVLPMFMGKISQTPPIYSALRIAGERAYELARRGDIPKIPVRQVIINALELLHFSPESAQLRVACGPGTYVRSLGQDLARAVGTLGYLSQLRRTRVGKFSLQDTINLDTLRSNVQQEAELSYLLPIRAVLDDIPAVPVSAQQKAYLQQGRSITYSGYYGKVMALCDDSEVALCEADGQQLQPTRVFNL
ncbi:tRNA pseudouridine(55) synthase TruB [Candidatus Odyssella thessalonicensis]|uniref:tRNA pseudouridine(55) synthase TruB n=1 Tax=Candidatus Odyssella thessalonicensis TaxID=84647 RepID=UPI000225B46B|nr:tRNA pseudouridine(55) synthase TruB [Candidatus Odyssella thessalonicensis]